ncbi:MFS transporter [Periweissella fabalis]|uniref:MFS transporter n=1 Tax=Periweissella fabalis TaxID=1070421 RepID=A0A7X6N216_9LACO|nr:MFS transporter [Periweissella fabalis]MCM0598663.1 hypothetical protein [Periweissella fabalis]NKZ24316.1 MFS transporter [Periweissella fabalis]
MNKIIGMFRLEPLVKLDDLWRAAYRNGYDKPRLLRRLGMYEMLWFLIWAIFTYRTVQDKIALLGLAMLIVWLFWMGFGPIVSIIDADTNRIRRLKRNDYRRYRQQIRGKLPFPKPSEVGIGAGEKLPLQKK